MIIVIYYDFNDLNYYSRICFLFTYAESHSQTLLQATVILDSGHFCTLFNFNSVNRAGLTQHGPLFSLQAARSYQKSFLSRGHGAKGPGSKQNYPCHLNIHASFQHPTIHSV